MNLPVAIAYSFLISVVCFGTMNLYLKKAGLIKYSVAVVTLIGTVLNIAGGLLHELVHALTANSWGLDTKWGGNFLGMYISTIPPIYKSSPIIQTTVALAGPLVSLVATIAIWYALEHTRSAAAIVILSYLLWGQGLGNFGSLLFVVSGDATNFAQGVSKLTLIPLESVVYVLLTSSIILTVLVLKRCIRSYQELKRLTNN